MDPIDAGSKKSRWRRSKTKPMALVVAGVMSFGGLVAATVGGTQAQSSASSHSESDNSASTSRDRAGARVCHPVYPYPGCTTSQIASLEAGTKRRAKRSYKAKRWGQKRDEFKNVRPRVNRILKRAWRHARAKWVARHPDQRLVIGSWKSFRRNLSNDGCTSLGFVPSIGAWCHFDNWFNEKILGSSRRVVNDATIACGSGALLFTVGGEGRKIARQAKLVAMTWREALAEGVLGCIGGLYSRYFTDLY